MKIKRFLPPGTIFNTSTDEVETIINRIYFNKDKISINDYIDNAQVWIRVNGFKDSEKIINELSRLEIDNLIIEDVFNLSQRAKIEEIENGILAIIKVAKISSQKFSHEYISVILKGNTVFTFNEKPAGILDVIQDRLEKDSGKVRSSSAKFLFYQIIDYLIDTNIVFEYELTGMLNEWEEKIISSKTQNIEELHQIRKEVLQMKTNTASMVDSLDFIDDIYKNPLISEYKKYYQDLIDHLYRLNDKLNIDWENLKTLYELHMNNITERTNSIMKILTIFSAVFIPLSFLAGVFGMNFQNMPILQNENGILLFIGLCVGVLLLMLGFFKLKKWF
jgi:magnesium transporter